jgi:hypothetical protein
MRDRLVELLRVPIYPKAGADPAEVVADYLLDNGVIVPPCKVGDTVYVVNGSAGKVFRNTVIGMTILNGSKNPNSIKVEYRNKCGEISRRDFRWAQFGKQVFLSRKEAEQALKGGAE